MKIEGIKTERLNLRNYEKADLDFIISIWNDPEMGKYMPDPSIENMDEEYRKVYETLQGMIDYAKSRGAKKLQHQLIKKMRLPMLLWEN